MRQLVFLIFLSLLFPHATFSATGAAGCDGQCNGLVVPYPFGFSGDCPILLSCNATASTASLLPPPGAAAGAAYPIMSFNSTSSTFIVSVATSCDRSVSEARAALTGAGYGASSRTGVFLRGGCAPGKKNDSSSGCAVPSDVMATLLRTAGCGGGGDGGGEAASWTCVASAPPDPSSGAAARGEGQFMRWEAVEATGCAEVLTAAVYAPTPMGVPAVEFGVAELGWWLDGSCGERGGANATGVAAGVCAANTTCRDVVTPSGEWGHRCACRDGMVGDGFAAGEGCSFAAALAAVPRQPKPGSTIRGQSYAS
nr:unnamed protein product [Digitaria exilis]